MGAVWHFDWHGLWPLVPLRKGGFDQPLAPLPSGPGGHAQLVDPCAGVVPRPCRDSPPRGASPAAIAHVWGWARSELVTAEERDLQNSGFAPSWGSVEVPGYPVRICKCPWGWFGESEARQSVCPGGSRGSLSSQGRWGRPGPPLVPSTGRPPPAARCHTPGCPHDRAPSTAHGLTLKDRIFREKRGLSSVLNKSLKDRASGLHVPLNKQLSGRVTHCRRGPAAAGRGRGCGPAVRRLRVNRSRV